MLQRKNTKVKNIVKAFIGQVDVTKEVLEERREKCKGCEFNTANQTALGKVAPQCSKCWCVISKKITQAVERCPIGLWPSTAVIPNNSTHPSVEGLGGVTVGIENGTITLGLGNVKRNHSFQIHLKHPKITQRNFSRFNYIGCTCMRISSKKWERNGLTLTVNLKPDSYEKSGLTIRTFSMGLPKPSRKGLMPEYEISFTLNVKLTIIT